MDSDLNLNILKPIFAKFAFSSLRVNLVKIVGEGKKVDDVEQNDDVLDVSPI
jgi:hypothetical protein